MMEVGDKKAGRALRIFVQTDFFPGERCGFSFERKSFAIPSSRLAGARRTMNAGEFLAAAASRPLLSVTAAATIRL